MIIAPGKLPPFVNTTIHYASKGWLLRNHVTGKEVASCMSSDLPKGMRKQAVVHGYLYAWTEAYKDEHGEGSGT